MRRREAETKRRTNETEIFLSLDLDGEGAGAVDSGVGFLNHMLDLFKTHSGINLSVVCRGDTEVDDHHSTEDVAIALGETFREALGDRKGIERFADCVVPMDETAALVAVDLSGRGVSLLRLSRPCKRKMRNVRLGARGGIFAGVLLPRRSERLCEDAERRQPPPRSGGGVQGAGKVHKESRRGHVG